MLEQLLGEFQAAESRNFSGTGAQANIEAAGAAIGPARLSQAFDQHVAARFVDARISSMQSCGPLSAAVAAT